MTRHHRHLALLALAALPVAAVVLLLLFGDLIRLQDLKARQQELQAMIALRPLLSTTAFVLAFALIASVSPGAAVLKVAAGALFGLFAGFWISLAATLLAATIGFLMSRYALRRWVETRFARQVEAINRGVSKDGAVYLLALRFNPLIPFFLINFGLGLTRMRLWVYVSASFVGLIPASFIYANAGTELARIEQASDILSFRLIASLLLLSLMPILGRAAAGWLRRRRGIVVDLPSDG